MLHKIKLPAQSFLSSVFLALIVVVPAFAQATTTVLINYHEVRTQADALLLDLYFNIADERGAILPETNIEGLLVQTSDGETIAANIARPLNAFYVALVLDASGSMGRANEEMRTATINAVRNPPSGARFAVLSFNDTVSVIHEFNIQGSVDDAINSVESKPDSGTCLYDAMAQAIDLIAEQPVGRRAIITFTDGIDETATGDPCSVYSADSVITYARRPELTIPVPIYTIGMTGNGTNGEQINAEDLTRIANGTGAFSIIGSQGELESLFNTVMNALRSQYLAQMTLYPTQGPNTISITPILEGNVLGTPQSFTYSSPTTFARPFSIIIDELRYRNNQVEMDLRAEGVERIHTLQVRFINADTNTNEATFLFDPIENGLGSLPRIVAMDASQLTAGTSYIIAVNGLNTDNIPILSQPVGIEYNHQPPMQTPTVPVQLTLQSTMLDAENACIRIAFSLLGREQITHLQVRIVSERTSFDLFSLPPVGREQNDFCVPLNQLEAGESYQIVVTALNGEQLLTQEPAVTEFNLPVPPPAQVVIQGVLQTPNTRDLTVLFDAVNVSSLQKMELSIYDALSRLLVLGPLEVNGIPERFTLPPNNLPAGKYFLITNIYDSTGAMSEIQPEPVEFVFTPPPPMFYETDFFRWLFVLAALALPALGLWFVVLWQRRKNIASHSNGNYLPEKTGFYRNQSFLKDFARSFTQIFDANARTEGATHRSRDKMRADHVIEKTSTLSQHAVDETIASKLSPILRVVRSTNLVNTNKTLIWQHLLSERGVILGSEGHIAFPNDRGVSRKHASIRYESSGNSERFVITDLGSTNGTTVDGEALEAHKPMTLSTDSPSRICLGENVEVEFEVTSPRRAIIDENRT